MLRYPQLLDAGYARRYVLSKPVNGLCQQRLCNPPSLRGYGPRLLARMCRSGRLAATLSPRGTDVAGVLYCPCVCHRRRPSWTFVLIQQARSCLSTWQRCRNRTGNDHEWWMRVPVLIWRALSDGGSGEVENCQPAALQVVANASHPATFPSRPG